MRPRGPAILLHRFILIALVPWAVVPPPSSYAAAVPPPSRESLVGYLGSAPWFECGDDVIHAWAPLGWQREAERVVEAARHSLPRVAHELGLGVDQVLPVWMVISPGGGGFAVEAPSWSAAIARPSRHLVVISGPALQGARMNLQETIAHEVAHLALGARLGASGWMPLWMHEGLAVHYSDYRRFRDRFVFWGRGPVHLQELEHRFPRHPTRARLAYLESHAAVLKMLEIGPVAPLLDRLEAGEEFDAAFAQVYGLAPGAFAEQVYGDVARRWRYFSVITNGASVFGAVTFLFVVAATVIRIRNRRRRREWERQEALEMVPDAPAPHDARHDSAS